jgi:1,4-dihydroxy-6-naphthoate synthase
MSTATRTIRIGHSPDPDDAFMVWALQAGKVSSPGFAVELVPQDIQSLNQRARKADLEVTAVSAGAYPKVADKYALLGTGSSFGRGYGPLVITREAVVPAGLQPAEALAKAGAWLAGKRIAVPGEDTTAFLLLNLALPGYTPVQADFTAIMGMVKDGSVDAGLLIHEGQLTYGREGFHKALDLWDWWSAQAPGLPMPLGLNAVRRDLGSAAMAGAGRVFRASVEAGLANEAEAVGYALNFGRGLDHATGTAFVRQYVNQDTLDLTGAPVAALRRLYELAVAKGLLAQVPDLSFF